MWNIDTDQCYIIHVSTDMFANSIGYYYSCNLQNLFPNNNKQVQQTTTNVFK